MRDRAQRPARTRSAPDHGQLRHPQDPGDPKVARRAADGMFTSPRPPAPGSIWSSASSPTSPKSRPAAASTAPPRNWKPRSAPTSTPSMKTQSPSAGQNPPTTFSPPQNASALNRSKSPQPKSKSHETQIRTLVIALVVGIQHVGQISSKAFATLPYGERGVSVPQEWPSCYDRGPRRT